jgi:LysR family hca operon transcriptional activator
MAVRIGSIMELRHQIVDKEPLVVLMPSDHVLASRTTVTPEDLAGEPFIALGGKAKVFRAVVDDYLDGFGDG